MQRIVRVCAAVAVVLGATALARADEMRVAVMEFTSAAKDPELETLGKGLQSMVTTDLAQVSSVKVVERQRLKDIEAELKLGKSTAVDPKTAAKIGKLAGASHLFGGSFTVVGDKMRLDGRLVAVQSGEVLLAEQISGEKALFFELEQQLVKRVIDTIGIKLQPKEKAALARPHTADFNAFKKFSDGIQAFDDGKVELAMKALNEATEIDKDFKLASMTLAEYERLAAQVRAKAAAAGRVEDEVRRLEKNQALAAELAAVKKLWAVLDNESSSPDAKLQRAYATCVLAWAYRASFGFQNRGPVTYEHLDAAGFDQFSRERTADALIARYWAEYADLFPKIPPLCIEYGGLPSADRVDIAMKYALQRFGKFIGNRETILSYISNNTEVDPWTTWLHLDDPGTVKVWERLYKLAERLQLDDRDREIFERQIAEHRRRAGDIDGSTQMFAAASRHTKESYRLRGYAEEIEKNKTLVGLVGKGAPPEIRELFLLRHESPSELERLRNAGNPDRIRQSLASAREVRERGMVIVGDLPTWRAIAPNMGAVVRTGPRTSNLRADELRYEGHDQSFRRGNEPPKPPRPTAMPTSARARKVTARFSVETTPPADYKTYAKLPLAPAAAGLAFALDRIMAHAPKGGQPIRVGWAVLVGADPKARLVSIVRQPGGDVVYEPIAEADVGAARGSRRSVEVSVAPGSVDVVVDGTRASLPWKPEAGRDEGFAGWAFDGIGYASVVSPRITTEGKK
jgi:TolB-like protein